MKHVRVLLVLGVIALGACGLDLDVADDGTSDAGALADVHAPVPTGTSTTPPPTDAAPLVDTGAPDTGADTGAPDTGAPDSGPPVCTPGTANCDGNDENGCETSTFDVHHCGGCNTQCSTNHDTPSCPAGTCILQCDTGWVDGDHDPANGCEVDSTLPGSCGPTLQNCTQPSNSTRTCSNGVCGFTCNAGSGNCDNLAGNGCEASLADVATCGTCGNSCVFVGGTSACNAGTCSIVTCATNTADCNSKFSDGCETSTLTDKDHCGDCDTKCTGMKTCINGTCT